MNPCRARALATFKQNLIADTAQLTSTAFVGIQPADIVTISTVRRSRRRLLVPSCSARAPGLPTPLVSTRAHARRAYASRIQRRRKEDGLCAAYAHTLNSHLLLQITHR